MDGKKVKLRLEHISQSYIVKNEVSDAVVDVSLDVYDNEFLVILGPGRCGKTVLLNMIAGLEKPVDGSLFLDGEEIHGSDERVENIIKLMGLQNFRDAYPHQLSVSTEQRIIIGRAFAMNPDLLLMDEPYGQMDIKLRFYLEDEVVRLWKETGSTVLFITHNIEEAVYLAERILILSNKPTTIKEDFKVDLPRPRDVTSPEFTKIRQYVTDQIKWW